MIAARDRQTIDRIVDHLSRASSILFVTGAGMSADSGLPTYRGVGGLYNHGETEEGYAIEELLSGDMMRYRPDLTWKYLRQIEEACRGATFNRGHAIIAEMEQRFPRVWTLTQNVDGFHLAAGSKNVIPIHGQLHWVRCTKCSWRTPVRSYEGLAPVPSCPECQGISRPDVVLFGEELPEDGLLELRTQLREGFDIAFSIGTTSVFPYIAYPIEVSRQRDKPTVEINPGRTAVSDLVRYYLPLGAAEALDVIWTQYQAQHGVASS